MEENIKFCVILNYALCTRLLNRRFRSRSFQEKGLGYYVEIDTRTLFSYKTYETDGHKFFKLKSNINLSK